MHTSLRLQLGFRHLAILMCVGIAWAADTSAGGKWLRHERTDKMTDKKITYFSLSSEEGKYPMIAIVCGENDRGQRVNHAIYAGQEALQGPKVAAQVRVDKKPSYVTFWTQFGSSSGATLDDNTARSLLTGRILLVRLQTTSERIAESTFTLAGLNVSEVKEACGPDVFQQ